MSGAKVYEPYVRARLGTAARFCEVVVLEWCHSMLLDSVTNTVSYSLTLPPLSRHLVRRRGRGGFAPYRRLSPSHPLSPPLSPSLSLSLPLSLPLSLSLFLSPPPSFSLYIYKYEQMDG